MKKYGEQSFCLFAVWNMCLKFLLLSLLLALLWKAELGHTCCNEKVEPVYSLLDVRYVNSLTVVVGDNCAEELFESLV